MATTRAKAVTASRTGAMAAPGTRRVAASGTRTVRGVAVATPAAVAFCFAAERKPARQQGRCQHANQCSHWTFHHLNWKENATSWEKAYYFFNPDLYSAMGAILEAPAAESSGWYPG